MTDKLERRSIGNAMPFANCPACRKQFEVSDWYDFKGDETIHCPNCEADLIVESVEAVMYVDLVPKDTQ